jgi:predicted ribosomally synthesized peptide with SipW-like signal peptide
MEVQDPRDLHVERTTAMSENHRSARAQRSRTQRLKALLAGGLVLGIGAAITLAAWNDSEFATGTFTAGHFDIEGSVDGSTFTDHDTSGGAASLSFSTGFDKLSASQTVAAPFVLHLDKDTIYDASVAVTSATGNGTAETHLTYEIVQVASLVACTPSAAGDAQVVPAGTAMDSVTGASPFTLSKSVNLGTDPGADVFLCIQVAADSGLVQGTSATGLWEFVATSQ